MNTKTEGELRKEAELKQEARRKKEEELKKEALKPKPKFYYDVKIECMLPATLTYRILAETPEQAADLIKSASPVSVKHRLIGRKELKLSVYDAGSSFMKLVRNLFR